MSADPKSVEGIERISKSEGRFTQYVLKVSKLPNGDRRAVDVYDRSEQMRSWSERSARSSRVLR